MTGWEIGVVIVFTVAAFAYVLLILGNVRAVERAAEADADRTQELALAAMEREMYMATLEQPRPSMFQQRVSIPQLAARRREAMRPSGGVPVRDVRGEAMLRHKRAVSDPVGDGPSEIPSEITEPVEDEGTAHLHVASSGTSFEPSVITPEPEPGTPDLGESLQAGWDDPPTYPLVPDATPEPEERA